MKSKTLHIISEIACAIFILLFVYAAVNKLLDIAIFRNQLMLVTGNRAVSALLSYLVPITELLIAGLLCFPATRIAGLYLFSALLFFFSAYIVYLLLREKALPCSCGGVLNSMSWNQHLLFNICFLLAGIALIILHSTRIEMGHPNIKIKSF